MKTLAAVCLLVALTAPPALGEVIEVKLSSLEGTYLPHDGRTEIPGRVAVIDLGGPVQGVNGVQIRWKGSYAAGLGDCIGMVFPWMGAAVARFEPRVARWNVRVGLIGNEAGRHIDFDQTQPFVPYGEIGDWSFLLDGKAELQVLNSALRYSCGDMVEPPIAEFTEVTLLVDVERATVANEVSLLGAIKAVFVAMACKP